MEFLCGLLIYNHSFIFCDTCLLVESKIYHNKCCTLSPCLGLANLSIVFPLNMMKQPISISSFHICIFLPFILLLRICSKAVSFVLRRLLTHQDAQRASRELARKAMEMSYDNCTCIVICFNQVCVMQHWLNWKNIISSNKKCNLECLMISMIGTTTSLTSINSPVGLGVKIVLEPQEGVRSKKSYRKIIV